MQMKKNELFINEKIEYTFVTFSTTYPVFRQSKLNSSIKRKKEDPNSQLIQLLSLFLGSPGKILRMSFLS